MYGQGKYRGDAVKAEAARISLRDELLHKAGLSRHTPTAQLKPWEALQLAVFDSEGGFRNESLEVQKDVHDAIRRTLNSLPRD